MVAIDFLQFVIGNAFMIYAKEMCLLSAKILDYDTAVIVCSCIQNFMCTCLYFVISVEFFLLVVYKPLALKWILGSNVFKESVLWYRTETKYIYVHSKSHHVVLSNTSDTLNSLSIVIHISKFDTMIVSFMLGYCLVFKTFIKKF